MRQTAERAGGRETGSTRVVEDWEDRAITRRIRTVLAAAAALLVLVLALPILTSFTSALDGVVAGIGVAYVVGFAEFVIAMVGAVAYCRWANRADDAAAAHRRELER